MNKTPRTVLVTCLILLAGTGILSAQTVDSISVYELSPGLQTFTFNITDPVLYSTGSIDFYQLSDEQYDIYISNQNGTLNGNGMYLTITCTHDHPFYGISGANNIDAVSLNLSDGSKVWASTVASYILGFNQSLTDAKLDDALGEPDGSPTYVGSQFSSITLGFGSSQPIASVPFLPRTGQTECYNETGTKISCNGTGQDGDIQAGITWPNPRFTVTYCNTEGPCSTQGSDCDGNSANDIVTDNLTGLIFSRNADLPTADMTWQQALSNISSLNGSGGLCGYTDWRLPNINELTSLIDRSRYQHALPLNHPFTNVSQVYYWSSTSGNSCSAASSIVGMADGLTTGYMHSENAKVWPIRGHSSGPARVWKTGQTQSCATGDDGYYEEGYPWPNPRFTGMGDCIKDNLIGLMWPRNGNMNGSAITWQGALDYVDSINNGGGLCGYTDWRLPNVVEMQSLNNGGVSSWPDWLEAQGFNNMPDYTNFYWTSTTWVRPSGDTQFDRAWIFYGHESVASSEKSVACGSWCGFVWPVRGGGIPPDDFEITVAKAGTGSGTVTASGIDCGTDCSETYAYGTMVTLTANAGTGSTFTSWSGCDSSSENTCTVTLTSNKSITAIFTINKHTLTVGKSGTGSGTITGTGINCGSDCSELINYGTEIVLTASASTGSSFISWTGCNSSSGNTCTVNMTSNKSVSASFTLNKYTLNIGKSGTGSGTVTASGINCGSDCSEILDYGTVVALTASENVGSTFTEWTGCDAVSSNVCALTITGNKSVSAVFTLNRYTLTATKTGTGSGTLTASGLSCVADTCTGIYNYGETVQITASPSKSSVFGEWTGCDSAADNVCTVNITSERSITASFYLEYTLAITLEGTGEGRVTSIPSGIDCEPTCSDTFIVGTPIQLTARPYAGSVFAYWSGGCAGTTETCELIMSDYIGVTAHFTSENTKEYKLNVKKAKRNKGDGIVTSKDGNIACGDICSNKYYQDTVVTLSATANEGSTFIGWKPTTLNCIGTDPCTVTIDKAKSVQAVFVGDYALKVTAQSKKKGLGTVTSIPMGINCSTGSKEGCTSTYPYAEQVVLSALADSTSTFLGWSPVKLCPGAGVCIVSMDKKRNIKAVFSGP